jgi:hypothetical protein
MSPQINTVEVNTNNKNFTWFRENSCIDVLQTKTNALSSMPGEELLFWAEISHFHLNAADPVSVVLYPYIIDEILQINMIDSSTNRLENFIAQKFIAIPGVEYVLISLENDSVDIWTVINKLDRGIREKIYDVEFDILGIISNFHFDFHVICRNDRSIKELYPSNAKMVFQK